MASDDLARLRAVVEALPEAPWVPNATPDGSEAWIPAARTVDGHAGWAMSAATADTIAALRNVAPELLAVAEAAELARPFTRQNGHVLGAALDALRAKLREVPR